MGWAVDVADPSLSTWTRCGRRGAAGGGGLLGATKPPSSRRTILLRPRLAITLVSLVAGC